MKYLDRSFFTDEMVKLQEQFSRSSFSPRKSDLIYLAIRHLDERQFANVIDFFIGDSKFAPNVQDFKDRARAFKNQVKKEPTDCTICGGWGAVSCYYKKTGVNYAFACTCRNGYDYPAYPKWADQKQHMFTRIAPKKLFLNGEGDPYEGKIGLKGVSIKTQTPKPPEDTNLKSAAEIISRGEHA